MECYTGPLIFKHSLLRNEVSFGSHKDKVVKQIKKQVVKTAQNCVNRPLRGRYSYKSVGICLWVLRFTGKVQCRLVFELNKNCFHLKGLTLKKISPYHIKFASNYIAYKYIQVFGRYLTCDGQSERSYLL